MKPLTARQLVVLSAWWWTGGVRAAATMLRIPEQTAKNTLYLARLRGGAGTNLGLAQQHMADMLSKEPIVTSHNNRRPEAA